MPDPPNLQKAELREIAWSENQEVQLKDKRVEVQFNPDSLKVNLNNQRAGGDQRGGSSMQYVGRGTSKLAFELWFDASAPPPKRVDEDGVVDESAVDDVRKLTREVAYFITAKTAEDQFIAPGVRFTWGTFWFDGIMDSLNETLSFFAEDGRPLRAQLSVSLSQQEIQFNVGELSAAARGGDPAPGTRAQTPARDGDTVQSLAGQQGKQDQAAEIGAANGLESLRNLEAGTALDLAAPRLPAAPTSPLPAMNQALRALSRGSVPSPPTTPRFR